MPEQVYTSLLTASCFFDFQITILVFRLCNLTRRLITKKTNFLLQSACGPSVGLSQLFQQMPGALVAVAVSPAFPVVAASADYHCLAKSTGEAVMAAGFFESFPSAGEAEAAYRSDLKKAFEAVLESRQTVVLAVQKHEFAASHSPNVVKYFEPEIRPFLDEQNNVQFLIVTFKDVTTSHDLQGSLVERDEFLSIASHELRSPLTAMTLMLQLLRKTASKRGLISSDEVLRALEPAERQVSRLTTLIDNLLDVSRIRQGEGIQLDLEEFSLRDLLVEISNRLRPQAAWKGSRLSVLPGKDVSGTWDRFRLDQVVTNLITNAIKYGESKPIELAVELREDGDCEIRVIDFGMGINAKDQERIFQRFERASKMHANQSLGLGLFIVQEIVSAHGGSISVMSKPHEGSVFKVILPVKHNVERLLAT